MFRTLTYLLIAFLIFSSSLANNTGGTPYLTNYEFPERSHNTIWSIAETPRNTILIAKRTGLTEYDSEEWTSISTPDIPLKLKSAKHKDKIYACGRNFAGYLSIEKDGKYHYHPIDTLVRNLLFTEIIETKERVYFYSPQLIIEHIKSDGTNKNHIFPENTYTLRGILSLNEKVYVSLLGKGIFELADSLGDKISTPESLFNSEIIFQCKYNDNEIILGTSNGTLFTFNGERFLPFKIEDFEVLTTGIVTDGIVLNESLLAISTKNLGVFLVKRDSGKTLSIINQNSGLPTNEVNALLGDQKNGLWFAHTKGISRLDTQLPVINYNAFAGLDANVNSLNFWKGILYLATSSGVYSLDTINVYDTKEMVEKIPVKSSFTPDLVAPVQLSHPSNNTPEKSNTSEPSISDSSDTEKRGFLKNLFGRKKNKSKPQVFVEPKIEEPRKTITIKERKQVFQTFKYETFVLKGKSYGYSKIDQISDQCNYFIPFANHLLAIGDAGIFSISTNKDVQKIFSSTNIFHVSPTKTESELLYVIASEGIFFGQYIEGKWEFTLQNKSDESYTITALIELSPSTFLLALNNQLVYYSIEDDQLRTIKIDNPYSERIYLKSAGTQNYVIVGNDLYKVFGDEIQLISIIKEKNAQVIVPYLNQENSLWIKGKDKTFKYFGNDSIPANVLAFLRVFDNITDIHIDYNQNIWIVDNNDLIYRIKSEDFKHFTNNVELKIKSVKTIKGNLMPFTDLNLDFGENGIALHVYSPTYIQENSNRYRYRIIGLYDNWTAWNANHIINIPYIPSGKYILEIQSKDLFGTKSEIKNIAIKVLPPFWETYYFYIGVFLFIAIIIFVIQRLRLRKLVKERNLLSEKVKERTREIELKNKAITDSINYAGKMQSGLLPSEDMISTYLANFFIFYKPRDIVSGDFYYATQKNQYTVLAAADCTGHGVPGAFMSMLGMAYMNEIVGKSTITTAAQVLETLRNKIIQLLSKRTAESRDGMDISLLIFDNSKSVVQYSGAHNPLYRIVSKKHKISEADQKFVSKENDTHLLLHYKANRFHVGKSNYTQVKFDNHKIEYNADDVFYIFSDGFADQFGGAEERKFMYGPFKKLLLDNSQKPMNEQKTILGETIKDWMEGYEQTDDMLIFGIKPK